MPSYVPYGKRNTTRLTRAATRELPTLLFLPLLPPIADKDCNPLGHNSPHKDPPAEFVEEAARAADPSDAMEDDDDDDDEERILGSTLHDLVGGKRSGLDDLGYSSDDDDEDYNNGIEEEACRIEYSDSNKVQYGRRQTNFIPGGPKPPPFDGMSATEMVFAKSEFKEVRKKYTDRLQMKRLKENNEAGCLALVLRPMTDVQKGSLEVNHTFLDKEILSMRVAKEANLRGVNLVCARSDLRENMCTGSRFCVKAHHTEKNGCNLFQPPHLTSTQEPRS